MNTTLSKVLIFAAGAAIGSAVTWKLLDAKYAQRADQEIKAVKEYYEGKYASKDVENDIEEEEVDVEYSDEEKEEYLHLVQNYTSEKGGSESVGTAPYVIPPEEFNTMDDYECESLTYYTDGVLADDNDDIIEDVDNIVGKDFASHFGEFEDDSVFVRNERLRTDYEILKDYRPYSDVVDTAPIPKDN